MLYIERNGYFKYDLLTSFHIVTDILTHVTNKFMLMKHIIVFTLMQP